MDKKKILIIDDEEDFCKLVKLNLEITDKFDVEIVNDGESGLKLAKKFKPDLVVLDIMMPGMDGYQVLEKLKKDITTIGIPVIMLSAKSDIDSKVKAAQLYDDLYIVKPVDTTTLEAKIDHVLKVRGG